MIFHERALQYLRVFRPADRFLFILNYRMAADPEGAVNDISEFLGVCPQDASFKIQRRHSSHKIAMREDTLVLLKERTCSDWINLLVVVGIDKNREQL